MNPQPALTKTCPHTLVKSARLVLYRLPERPHKITLSRYWSYPWQLLRSEDLPHKTFYSTEAQQPFRLDMIMVSTSVQKSAGWIFGFRKTPFCGHSHL